MRTVIILVAVAVFFCGGAMLFATFMNRDQLLELQTQGAAAQAEILERTKLQADVSCSSKSSFGSGLTRVDVTVTYKFLPPTADPEQLVTIAEEAVHRHIKNVVDIQVDGQGIRHAEPKHRH